MSKLLPNHKKDIVFFHPHFRDGGVEKTNLRLAKEFVKQGHDVTMLSLSFSRNFDQDIKEYKIKSVALGGERVITVAPRLLRYLWRTPRDTIFIACQNYVNIYCIMLKVFFPKRVKLVAAERNHPYELELKKGIKSRVILRGIRFFYHYADLVIANSHQTAKTLSAMTGSYVHSVYNPTIDDQLILFKNNANVERDKNKILFLGRLDYQKDPETLLKAFSLVNKNHPEYVLHFVGDGPYLERLQRLEKELNLPAGAVIFKGFSSNPFAELASSSLLVLPSLYEGLPNVLIEALYLNTPVIASDCPSGPREILKNGIYGVLFEAQDIEDLASKIIHSISKGNKEGPQDEWMTQFTSAVSAKRYLELFEKI